MRRLGELEAEIMDLFWRWNRPATVRELVDDINLHRELLHACGLGTHTHLVPPHHLHLRAHESLVLYTDGITEARRADGEMLGAHRLAETAADLPGHPRPQQIIDGIITTLHTFTDGGDIDDDQAILVLTATPHRPATS
ncbi:SpoIIE family protein phosphatase [Streptomyces cyaneofuscatus]|uniref:SpoIIE family protein phosphatase n=1 Tax=Streptomyces cyaneofuscatus TaxID=66883 RepID=UPI0036C42D59